MTLVYALICSAAIGILSNWNLLRHLTKPKKVEK